MFITKRVGDLFDFTAIVPHRLGSGRHVQAPYIDDERTDDGEPAKDAIGGQSSRRQAASMTQDVDFLTRGGKTLSKESRTAASNQSLISIEGSRTIVADGAPISICITLKASFVGKATSSPIGCGHSAHGKRSQTSDARSCARNCPYAPTQRG